ncbi:hypothetical protein PUNSTDRAFT_72165, partial [Punctularia strigosozonata HHB-11173 SS5]|uniref:uncharacterized protein n=1 Tax=Punctularia strigosozonata (strain HHB-11173) TaxID=741275 RepID=UPI0004417F75
SQVEHRLFRVHRYFLERESPYFKRTFLGPFSQTSKNPFDNSPIILADVSIEEFRTLLDFIYQGMHRRPQTPAYWTSLLSIATKYEFPAIRTRAIAELKSPDAALDPIAEIVLAMTYAIPEWLPGAYQKVCLRPSPLEVEEAERLGLRTAMMLAKARELVRTAVAQTRALRMPPDNEETVKAYAKEDEAAASKIVVEVFGPEAVASA